MSEAIAANAAETVAPTPPAEPEHLTRARDALKVANRLLNEKLAAWTHFQSVFGAEAPETAKALGQVLEAQELANAAAHHKGVKALEHGVSRLAKQREEMQAKLADVALSGDVDALRAHVESAVRIDKAHAESSALLAARISKSPIEEGKG